MSSLVPMSVLLTAARRGNYALPAFNVDSFDMMLAVVSAAEAARSPLILQVTEPAVRFLGVANAVALAHEEAARSRVRIALHLDHADNLAIIEECLRAGFTSAMIDGSTLEWAANIEITRAARTVAQRYGASIEAEIGHVGTSKRGSVIDLEGGRIVEDDPTVLTNPDDARRFIEETDVDALAVSVGTSHGLTARTKSLDLQRLALIAASVSIPLVLHGSSGVRERDLESAARMGISKMNVETELRIAFRRSLETALAEDPTNIKPRLLMGRVRQDVKEKALARLQLLGCIGREDEDNEYRSNVMLD